MKLIIKTIKVLSLVTAAGSQLTPIIPESYLGWATVVFLAASTAKDLLYSIGDQLDNGKQDKSLEV